jgi:hypothetical protein
MATIVEWVDTPAFNDIKTSKLHVVVVLPSADCHHSCKVIVMLAYRERNYVVFQNDKQIQSNEHCPSFTLRHNENDPGVNRGAINTRRPHHWRSRCGCQHDVYWQEIVPTNYLSCIGQDIVLTTVLRFLYFYEFITPSRELIYAFWTKHVSSDDNSISATNSPQISSLSVAFSLSRDP